MGLLDLLDDEKSNAMSPAFAFVVSLLYLISADGEIAGEEIALLLSVVGGRRERGEKGAISVRASNPQYLDRAIEYRSKHSLATFLTEAAPLLSTAQRRCIMANLIDLALSEGQLEQHEKEMLHKFFTAFQINEAEFKPYFDLLKVKNDYSPFLSINDFRN